MPAYHVTRSILIDAPQQQVKESLQNFHEWPKWSPWLIMEPEAKLEYHDSNNETGSSYNWSGDLVGKGSMQMEDIRKDRLDMQLKFIKPFKSQAKVTFDIEPEGNSTFLRWHMNGKLPFFLFFMKKKMKAWIGMDYDRGLAMLKDYIETGSVHSSIKIEALSVVEPQRYVGLQQECSTEELGEVMTANFENLDKLFREKGWPLEGIPFSIYHKMDIINSVMKFTTAIPVSEKVEISAPFITGTLKQSSALKIIHAGKYEHLGNAWATAMTYARYKKLKIEKNNLGIEKYMNDPSETSAEKLVTEILIPLRG